MKRLFDLSMAFSALVLLSPVFAIVALLVRLKLGRPIFFRQIRPGKWGKPFEVLKFRTMMNAADCDGVALPDGDRLTSFGKLLRSTSLDELPELFNIIRGEMSLVGPRPLLMEYLPLYSPDQARRHDVRPGLTGLAQISGRNAISWEEKFKLDTWYVENRSFLLDLRILWKTGRAVIIREGIAADGEATMPPFTGRGDEQGRT